MSANVIKKTFEDNEIEVRQNGGAWLKAADMSSALGIQNTSEIVGRLADDEKQKFQATISTGYGGSRQMKIWYVNEPGAYRLAFESQGDKATRFKRWLAHEVIPEIRKTGTYSRGASENQSNPEVRSDEAEDLPKEVQVNWEGNTISHFLTEEEVYTSVEDVADAIGYKLRQRMALQVGSYLHHNRDVYVDEAGLKEWLFRSTGKGTSELAVEYGPVVENLNSRQGDTPLEATFSPEDEKDAAETQESGVEGNADSLRGDGTELSPSRPAFFDWGNDRMREEIKRLVNNNMNNYGRIYNRMRVRHGIDVDELEGGSSYLDAMDKDQLRVALHVADQLLA